MSFAVETLKFEGPLDLMLHLIREQKLDIFDLDMEVLTDQYIAYINALEELRLEVESEYLVELATLIEYKSKRLLPKPVENLEDDYEDPKEKLVRRLLEYQKYKDVSATLNEAYLQRQDQLAKTLSIPDNDNEEDFMVEGDPYALLKAMNKVLRRAQMNRPLLTKYTTRELSTEDRILELKASLINLPEVFGFEELLSDCRDLSEYIVTFLAILDLAKDHFLSFSIDDNENVYFGRGSAYGQ